MYSRKVISRDNPPRQNGPHRMYVDEVILQEMTSYGAWRDVVVYARWDTSGTISVNIHEVARFLLHRGVHYGKSKISESYFAVDLFGKRPDSKLIESLEIINDFLVLFPSNDYVGVNIDNIDGLREALCDVYLRGGIFRCLSSRGDAVDFEKILKLS